MMVYGKLVIDFLGWSISLGCLNVLGFYGGIVVMFILY